MTLYRVFYLRQGIRRTQTFTAGSAPPGVYARLIAARSRGEFLDFERVKPMKDVYIAEAKPSPWPLVLTSLLTGCVMYMVGEWRAESQFLEQAISLRQQVDKTKTDIQHSIKTGCYDFVKNRGGQ